MHGIPHFASSTPLAFASTGALGTLGTHARARDGARRRRKPSSAHQVIFEQRRFLLQVLDAREHGYLRVSVRRRLFLESSANLRAVCVGVRLCCDGVHSRSIRSRVARSLGVSALESVVAALTAHDAPCRSTCSRAPVCPSRLGEISNARARPRGGCPGCA